MESDLNAFKFETEKSIHGPCIIEIGEGNVIFRVKGNPEGDNKEAYSKAWGIGLRYNMQDWPQRGGSVNFIKEGEFEVRADTSVNQLLLAGCEALVAQLFQEKLISEIDKNLVMLSIDERQKNSVLNTVFKSFGL